MILQEYVNLIEDLGQYLGVREDIEFTDFGLECLNILLYSKILDKCIFEQLFADRFLNGINKAEFRQITSIAIDRGWKLIRG